jgi:DNA-binding MarR family transcriptional regulator
MAKETEINQKTLEQYVDKTRKFPRMRSIFWLLRCTDAFSKFASYEIKKTGDTHSRIRIAIMEFILKHPNGVSQQAIADYTGRTKQAITVAIDVLEKRGHVKRFTSNNNRRVYSVRITQAGIEHLYAVLPHTVEMCNEALSPLSDTEVDQLLSLVMKVTKNIWKKTEDQSSEIEETEAELSIKE